MSPSRGFQPPDLSRPIGMFVLIMDGQLSYWKLNPYEIKLWKDAWAQKSKWYRSRLKWAAKKRLDWFEFDDESGFPTTKAEVYRTWLERGDRVVREAA